MFSYRNSVFTYALLLFFVLCAVAGSYNNLSSKKVTLDAAENLSLAYNLVRCHSYSSFKNSACPPLSTMEREPLPIFVLAVWLKVTGTQSERSTFDKLNSGNSIKKAKAVNLLWVSILVVMGFFATKSLTKSDFVSLSASVAIGIIAVGMADTLYTEIPGAAMILIPSYALSRLVQDPKPWVAGVAGALLGAAALTKALIFYLIPLVTLAVGLLLYFGSQSRTRSFFLSILVLVGAGIVTGPWVARNIDKFQQVRISARAGPVLYYRALLNTMTNEEYRGSFFAWAPPPVRAWFMTLLGYQESDLELGGPLERLMYEQPGDRAAVSEGRPDLAITYYRKTKAELRRLRELNNKEALPRLAAELELEKEAKRQILQHPFRHIALMPPIAWQMLWIAPLPWFLALPLFLLGFVVTPIVALSQRRWDLIAFSLLPVCVFAAHVVLTHGVERLMRPLFATMVISSIVLLSLVRIPGANLRPLATR